MVSDEKSGVDLIEDLLYINELLFSGCFQVSLFLSSDNLIIICLHVDLFELILLSFIEFYKCLDSSDLQRISTVMFRLKF